MAYELDLNKLVRKKDHLLQEASPAALHPASVSVHSACMSAWPAAWGPSTRTGLPTSDQRATPGGATIFAPGGDLSCGIFFAF